MTQVSEEVKTLGYMVDGEWRDSKSETWVDITDSNTGKVIARTPMCTQEEVTEAIESANAAYPAWASKPIQKRTEVLFTWRPKLIERMDEIATLARPSSARASTSRAARSSRSSRPSTSPSAPRWC